MNKTHLHILRDSINGNTIRELSIFYGESDEFIRWVCDYTGRLVSLKIKGVGRFTATNIKENSQRWLDAIDELLERK